MHPFKHTLLINLCYSIFDERKVLYVRWLNNELTNEPGSYKSPVTSHEPGCDKLALILMFSVWQAYNDGKKTFASVLSLVLEGVRSWIECFEGVRD